MITPEEGDRMNRSNQFQRMGIQSMFLNHPPQRNAAEMQRRSFYWGFQCTPTNILMLFYIFMMYVYMSSHTSANNHHNVKMDQVKLSNTTMTEQQKDPSLSLLVLLMPSCCFICVSLMILRRIRALRATEIGVIHQLNRNGGGGFPGMSAPMEARLRLMLANRDFGADDYEALLGLEEGTPSRSRHNKASRSDLDKLPIQTIEESDLERQWECPICLERFQLDDSVRTLPCLHRMHTTCIDPWLSEQNATCPVCKFSVITE